MRISLCVLALGALSACAPAIPESGAGVGFDNSISAQRSREAALTGAPGAALPPSSAISNEVFAPPPNSTFAQSVSVAPTQPLPPAPPASNRDAILEAAASLEESEANSGVAPLQASPSNPAPQIIGNPGISDENDFAAVSGRQTIESDAQRLAQISAQRQQVAPTAVPTRSGSAQPNVVEYALQTAHPRGSRLYSRIGVNLVAKAQRNCARYVSADEAQIAFLARDRLGLDPDGDGYACAWDPAPFRAAVRN